MVTVIVIVIVITIVIVIGIFIVIVIVIVMVMVTSHGHKSWSQVRMGKRGPEYNRATTRSREQGTPQSPSTAHISLSSSMNDHTPGSAGAKKKYPLVWHWWLIMS